MGVKQTCHVVLYGITTREMKKRKKETKKAEKERIGVNKRKKTGTYREI